MTFMKGMGAGMVIFPFLTAASKNVALRVDAVILINRKLPYVIEGENLGLGKKLRSRSIVRFYGRFGSIAVDC